MNLIAITLSLLFGLVAFGQQATLWISPSTQLRIGSGNTASGGDAPTNARLMVWDRHATTKAACWIDSQGKVTIRYRNECMRILRQDHGDFNSKDYLKMIEALKGNKV